MSGHFTTTMKADDARRSGSRGSNASRAPSIFKNPFEVEKDQLIRQLFELPVRVAAVVQTRRNYMSNAIVDKIESPFSILAGKLTATEEMEIEYGDWSNPMFLERSECASNTSQEGIGGSLTYGGRKRRRFDQSGAAASSLEHTFKISADGTLGNEGTPRNELSQLNTDCPQVYDVNCKNKRPLGSGNDEVLTSTFESKQDKNFIEKCMVITQSQGGTHASFQTARDRWAVAGQDKVVQGVPVSTIKVGPHDVARFIITVIRTLRHTRHDSIQKLLEILSVPDFPVEKCSFVEELVQQAYRYNKLAVAKELAQYHREICQVDSTIAGD